MAAMFHRKHHSRERLPDGPQTRPQRISGAARWLAALGVVVSSAGCILTKDLPDPALDIPTGYKAARLTSPDAPPIPIDSLSVLAWLRLDSARRNGMRARRHSSSASAH